MRLFRSLLLAPLLVACTQQAPVTQAVPSQPFNAAQVKAPASIEADPQVALGKAVHIGMGYADFRHKVLALGWKPLKSPDCPTNLNGDQAFCQQNKDLLLCHACDEIPELESYSGDGQLQSFFRHPTGLTLRVGASGDLQYWSDAGNNSGLSVTYVGVDE